jgi:hypothetical protein
MLGFWHIGSKPVSVLWKVWKVWKLFFAISLPDPLPHFGSRVRRDAPNVCRRRNVWEPKAALAAETPLSSAATFGSFSFVFLIHSRCVLWGTEPRGDGVRRSPDERRGAKGRAEWERASATESDGAECSIGCTRRSIGRTPDRANAATPLLPQPFLLKNPGRCILNQIVPVPRLDSPVWKCSTGFRFHSQDFCPSRLCGLLN